MSSDDCWLTLAPQIDYPKSHKSLLNEKSDVEMEPSKTKWEWQHNTFIPSLHLVPFCQLCVVFVVCIRVLWNAPVIIRMKVKKCEQTLLFIAMHSEDTLHWRSKVGEDCSSCEEKCGEMSPWQGQRDHNTQDNQLTTLLESSSRMVILHTSSVMLLSHTHRKQ